MAGATRTVNPIHFEDLEPHRFEDLVRQLAYGFRSWLRIEATGRLGADQGVDIRAVEASGRDGLYAEDADEERDDDKPIIDEREWRFQCKRYKVLRPVEVRRYVRDAVRDATSPYGLVLAAACDVTEKALSAFHEEARSAGVVEHQFWTRAHIEDMLFRPENDHLLFAYFGISLTARHRSRVADLRHDLAIKRKLLRILGMDDINLRMPFAEFLVRDVEDVHYPDEDDVPGFQSLESPPWHVVVPDEFRSDGLVVKRGRYSGWVRDDGTWDVLDDRSRSAGQVMGREYRESSTPHEEDEWERSRDPEIVERVPEEEQADFFDAWLIPLSHILLIDEVGDPAYTGPHLFCSFNRGRGPYIGKSKVLSYQRRQFMGAQGWADPEKRQPLFTQLGQRSRPAPVPSEDQPAQ